MRKTIYCVMVPEAIKGLYKKFFNTSDNTIQDKRKKEYGNLNEIRFQRRIPSSIKRYRINRKSLNKCRVPLKQSRDSLLYTLNIGNSLNHFVKNLKFIFSNDAENITNMRVACENFSLLSNNSNAIHDSSYINRNKIIRERIRQSRSFKKKLAERDYDRRQLNALKRSLLRKEKDQSYSYASFNDSELNNDKILLLQRQNKRLKKELLQRESELRILKKELKFLQKHTNFINRDTIPSIPNTNSNDINKMYKTNHNIDKYYPIDNIIEERSKSFSPVQVDYSQYSR